MLKIIERPKLDGQISTVLSDLMKKNHKDLGTLAKFYSDRKAGAYEQQQNLRAFQKEERILKSLQTLITAYVPHDPGPSKQQERVISSHRRQISAIEAKKSPIVTRRNSVNLQFGYFTPKGFKIEKNKSTERASARNLKIKLEKSGCLVSMRQSLAVSRSGVW